MSLDQRIRSTLEAEAEATSRFTPAGPADAMRRGTRRRRTKKSAWATGGVALFAGMIAFLGSLGSPDDIYLAAGEELLLTDPVVVQGALGPEPNFTINIDGAEAPLSQIEDLDALVRTAVEITDGELERITVIGQTPNGERAAIVEPLEGPTTLMAGSGTSTFGISSEGALITTGERATVAWPVPEATSLAILEILETNGTSVWQRPTAGVAVFDADLGPGIRFRLTALNPDGTVLAELSDVTDPGDTPPTDPIGTEFDSVSDMRNALGSAEFECDAWTTQSPPPFPTPAGSDFATCTANTQLMVLPEPDYVREVMTTIHDAVTAGGADSYGVEGENWLAACGSERLECETIQRALGGELVSSPASEGPPDTAARSFYCDGFDPGGITTEKVVFYAQCEGGSTLPPVPIYRNTSRETTIQEAVEALLAGTTPEEQALGFITGFDLIEDRSQMEVVTTVDANGVARVDFLESGQRWNPGPLASASAQLLSFLDPLMATVFHFTEVTGFDSTTLCWGEASCSGTTTRETWESVNFINSGVIASRDCTLEQAWLYPGTCTTEGALLRQHTEKVANIEAGTTLTLRAGPGEEYVPVAEVTLDEMVAVIDLFTNDGGWRLIATDGGLELGWIREQYLEPA